MSVRVERIGNATLYLGDCMSILPTVGEVTDVATDPPYSSGGLYRSDRSVKPSAKYQQSQSRERYAEFSGDNRDQRSFRYWSTLWLSRAREQTKPGGLVVCFTDWRQLPTTTDAVQAGGWVWRGLGTWNKGRGARPMLGRYRNQAEFFVWGSNGPRPLAGRCADGVIEAAVIGRQKQHMTEKPVKLLRDVLDVCGDVILDPFMGSGTTGVAAIETGRAFVGIEVDPHSFEVACERIANAQRLFPIERAA